MSFVDDDLAFILADTGADTVPVVLGGWSGRGILEAADDFDSDGGGALVKVTRTVLKLRRADHQRTDGSLRITREDTVKIDGVTWTIEDIRMGSADGAVGGLEIDGRELHLFVRRV